MSYRTSKIYQNNSSPSAGGGGGFNPIAEATLDITGLTNINMAGLTNYGIINLISSNTTESIVSVSNLSNNNEYIFRPRTLDITLTDSSVTPDPTDNLKLANETLVIMGTAKGYFTLQRRVTAEGTYYYSKQYLDAYIPF